MGWLRKNIRGTIKGRSPGIFNDISMTLRNIKLSLSYTLISVAYSYVYSAIQRADSASSCLGISTFQPHDRNLIFSFSPVTVPIPTLISYQYQYQDEYEYWCLSKYTTERWCISHPIPKKRRRAQKFIRTHQNQDRIFTVQFQTPAKQCFQLRRLVPIVICFRLQENHTQKKKKLRM